MRPVRGNRRRRSRWLVVALALALSVTQAAPVPTQDPAREQKKLDRLRLTIEVVQQRLHNTRGQQNQLSKQLEASELQIGQLVRNLNVLAGQLQKQQKRLDDLQQLQQTQLKALAGQRDALRRQVQAAYMMGRQEKLKILLNQQDPGLVSRMLSFYEYLNKARVARMQAIRDRLDQLAKTRKAIDDQRRQLLALQDQRTQEKLAMENAQTARRQVIAKLGQQIVDQGHRLAGLRENEARLQSLLRDLREALQNSPEAPRGGMRFANFRGRLQWPVHGHIEHAFGDPKIGALRWDGVLISAPEGRQVRAVFPGRVVFADWLRGFGLLMIIDHGNGYMTLYGHNQSLFKEVGDWVQAGEPIAVVGDTGGRSEAGVYFAIRKDGKPINPAHWCRESNRGNVG